MNGIDPNKLWEAFIEEVRIDADIPVLGNFLGSVSHHKKLFNLAVKKLQEKEAE